MPRVLPPNASRDPRSLRSTGRIAAAFTSAVLVLVVGISAYSSIRAQREAEVWVEHTYHVDALVARVIASLTDAETGLRGFLLVGDSAYLQAYTGAGPAARLALDSLRRLTVDNAAQGDRLDRLGPLITARLERLRASERAPAGPERRARLDAGKRTMDSLRVVIAEIQTAEHSLLGERRARRNRQRRTTIAIVLGGSAIAFLLALFATEALRRDIATRGRLLREVSQTRDTLHTQAEALDAANQQLHEQTTELELANEQLHEQAAEMEAQSDELLQTNDQLSRMAVQAGEARTIAETASRAKAELLRTVSHETRQPIHASLGYLDLLEAGLRGPLTDDQRADIVRIRQNQRHLLSLVNDLLTFSRLDAGALRLDISDVDANDVIASLEALVRPQYMAKGVRYEATRASGPAIFRGDRDRVTQICLNLLTNALKATLAEGEVFVACAVEPDRIVITVRDSGIGIPADRREAIFDPFTQLGRALNNPADGGVGLGLSISRQLARGMAGDLTVESVVGEGSVFELTLPRAGVAVRALGGAGASDADAHRDQVTVDASASTDGSAGGDRTSSPNPRTR